MSTLSVSKKLGFWGGGCKSAVGRLHASACRLDGLWNISAGAFSRDINNSIETLKKFNLEKCSIYSSLEEMISKENNLDAIVILTPTPQHYEGCLHVMNNSNISIFCEKTVATSVAKSEELERIARQNNTNFFCFFNYTGYPMLREAKTIINRGLIGEILSVEANMLQQTFLNTKNNSPITPQAWRLKDAEIPCVSLDLGVHLMNLIEFVSSQKITHINAVEASLGCFPNVIDYVSGNALINNNIHCSFKYGKSFLGRENDFSITIYGKHGSLQWSQLTPDVLKYSKKGEVKHLHLSSDMIKEASSERYQRFKAGHPSGFVEAFANYYYDLYQDNKEYTFGLSESIHNMKILEAVHQSAKSNSSFVHIQ